MPNLLEGITPVPRLSLAGALAADFHAFALDQRVAFLHREPELLKLLSGYERDYRYARVGFAGFLKALVKGVLLGLIVLSMLVGEAFRLRLFGDLGVALLGRGLPLLDLLLKLLVRHESRRLVLLDLPSTAQAQHSARQRTPPA